MNILFVSSGNSKEGIGPIVLNQGQSLIDQGISIDFFTIKGKGFWSYFRHIFILRQYLSKKNFDIIHAHFGLCGILSLLSKRKEKIIVSFMGDDLLGSNKSDGSISIISRLMAFTNKWISRIFYHATIVKSNEMILKHGNTPNLYLIANGVDLNKFQPLSKAECRKKLFWEKSEFYILFASNPARIEKNHVLVEKAIQLIDGTHKINLQYIKDVLFDNVSIYMNASDLLILSSFHEGSPNVIKEAMACNCPIVSTNVGDVEWVLGSTDGCFITSFEKDDVAEKIKLGLEFSKIKGQTNGRNRIIELKLDAENVAKKIIEVYKKVLE